LRRDQERGRVAGGAARRPAMYHLEKGSVRSDVADDGKAVASDGHVGEPAAISGVQHDGRVERGTGMRVDAGAEATDDDDETIDELHDAYR